MADSQAPISDSFADEPAARADEPAPRGSGFSARADEPALRGSDLSPRADDPAAREDGRSEDEEESSTRLHLVVGSLIGGAVIIAILLGVLTQAKGSKLEPGKPVPGAAHTMRLLAGIPQHGFTLGSPHARVSLTELCDLQSTACAAFSREALPGIISRYVRPGRLRIVFSPLALIGHESERAAQTAAALAAQNRLWQFADLMYRNQGHEDSGYVTEGYLAAIVTAIPGASLARVVETRESTPVRAELARASAQARVLRVTGTPAFLLSRAGGPSQRVTAAQILQPAAFSEVVEHVLDHRR